ncbi:hypothetical protein CVV67_17860 [Arthrobacter stackebrandtii]|nr:hypothetical protein CVV67_17860 [Arthrobacter stackebrandtii]
MRSLAQPSLLRKRSAVAGAWAKCPTRLLGPEFGDRREIHLPAATVKRSTKPAACSIWASNVRDSRS